MNGRTESILNFDPMAATEALINKNHEDLNTDTDSSMILGIAIMANQVKTEHLKNINDSYLSIKFEDFISIARAYGFKYGFCRTFIGSGWSGPVEETEVILYHENKGLILYVETFNGENVNNAKVYGELKISESYKGNPYYALSGCSYSHNDDDSISFYCDVREGFLHYMEKLSEAFSFSKTWSNIPFMWLLNYKESHKFSDQYEEITKKKINLSTPEVRKIVFGK